MKPSDKKTSKHLQGLRTFLASPFFTGLVVVSIVALLAADFYKSRGRSNDGQNSDWPAKLLTALHQKSIDLRLRDRGPKKGSEQVAILAIDERALEQEGHWVWSRAKIARLVDRAIALGAKTIAFDFVFPEVEPDFHAEAAAQIGARLSIDRALFAKIRPALDKESLRPSPDSIFAGVIGKNASKLVMGSYFDGARFELKNPAVAECVTTALELDRSAPRLWDASKTRLIVVDPHRAHWPAAMKAHLEEYLGVLQTNEAGQWLDKNPQARSQLLKGISDLGAEISADDLAVALRLWTSGRMDNLAEALAPSLPKFDKKTLQSRLEAAFAAAIPDRETLRLRESLQTASELYCDRVFSEDDEMLSEKAYLKRFAAATSQAAAEGFAAISWESGWSDSAKSPAQSKESFKKWLAGAQSAKRIDRIETAGRIWTDNAQLAAATLHAGHFNAKQDLDGTLRRSMLVVRRGDVFLPSLALEAFLTAQNLFARLVLSEGSSLAIEDSAGKTVFSVPIDPDGDLTIDYAGPRGMFPYISAADILNEAPTARIERQIFLPEKNAFEPQSLEVDKKEFLRDKILVFAATATGIYDLRVTPFDENYPGAETHANAISNLLERKFLRADAREPQIMVAAIFVLGVVFSGLFSWLGPLSGLIAAVLSLTGLYAFDRFCLFANGIVAASILPAILIAGLYLSLAFHNYFFEERRKRELKGVFEKYVSPAIVAEVLASPENIELGGKKMSLTVLFSDVRGFTSISEKLDPRALSDLLNGYLTPMTDLVFAHKGTLDKYMGDAIMAFWGAPLSFPDHAQNACRCALAMIDELKVLQMAYRKAGLPEIDIGIGINTGEMSVGNMGSNTVRSYTVMGDAVNLGSRLESINKQYGTRIIVSEFVFAQVQSEFVAREIDVVRVKGKVAPVRIYELLREKDAAEKSGEPTKWSESLQRFAAGYARYHEGDFRSAQREFRLSLEANANDACAKLFYERCEEFLSAPPPADWDGVVEMKTK